MSRLGLHALSLGRWRVFFLTGLPWRVGWTRVPPDTKHVGCLWVGPFAFEWTKGWDWERMAPKR